MDTEHRVQVAVTVRPVNTPTISVGAGKHCYTTQLNQTQTFEFDFFAAGNSRLFVEHSQKHDNDHNTAVEIVNISFFGISHPKFIWCGNYLPCYPAHYPDQKPVLPGQGYLGWNGRYTLEFDVPVFAWMHRTLDMGWLYS